MADAAADVPSYAHPVVATCYAGFKLSALAVYIVCGLFSKSFVTNFVVVVVLLMADFWTTKNVAGRLLVGLRWWNEVTDAGGSNWRFESLDAATAGRTINPKDATIFWWLLYGVPPVWLLLGIVALARLKLDYLIVVAIAVALGGANAVGYTKCSKSASAAVRSYATQAISQGLTAAMGRVV